MQIQRTALMKTAKLAVLFAAILVGSKAMAQQTDSNELNRNGQAAPKGGEQVGQPVNQELYGNTGPHTPIKHYQSTVLPSEARMAIERSGATPSELRTQADRVGPLSPNGAGAYVPAQSALQRALGLPVPILFNPFYYQQNPAGSGQSSPQVPIAAPNRGPLPQVRDVQSPQYIQPQRMNGADPLNSILVPTEKEGTVYYKLPVKPTTQPATQPASPGERP